MNDLYPFDELRDFDDVFQENNMEPPFQIIYLPCLIILGAFDPHIS
jgi:hypothetical protein